MIKGLALGGLLLVIAALIYIFRDQLKDKERIRILKKMEETTDPEELRKLEFQLRLLDVDG